MRKQTNKYAVQDILWDNWLAFFNRTIAWEVRCQLNTGVTKYWRFWKDMGWSEISLWLVVFGHKQISLFAPVWCVSVIFYSIRKIEILAGMWPSGDHWRKESLRIEKPGYWRGHQDLYYDSDRESESELGARAFKGQEETWRAYRRQAGVLDSGIWWHEM